MAGFAGSYISFVFDKTAPAKLKRQLGDLFVHGMTAWVEEAKSIIPVWSGAERSALTKIAGFVGVPVFGPGRGTGSAHSNQPRPDAVAFAASRWPNAGYTLAQRQAEGAQSESFQVEQTNSRFKFVWSSNLFHLNVNERTNATSFGIRLIQPGPYNLRQRCNDAFRKAVKEELGRNAIDFRKFFNSRRFKIGN